MPYTVDSTGQLRTPGGCRIDRGLCLDYIAINHFQEYVEFNIGGTSYFWSGSGAHALFAEFINRPDPGCVFNNVYGWGSKRSGLSKEEPPHKDEDDLWTYAYPPDYLPE